jgi:hypothetical protein
MAIKELDPGQRHSLPLSALRVQLTGTIQSVVLKAVDQAGDESVTVRLKPTEIVLTPQPRRLRLVASPADGGSFAAGASLGLTLLTEGATTSSEQVLVSAVDVGALRSHEIATLEFATDRTILTVAPGTRNAPTAAPKSGQTFMSSKVFDAPTPVQDLPAPDDQEHIWLQPGRYALRDADRLGSIADPVDAWGVVLDGSASMLPLYRSGQLDVLLGLVCGTYVHWTSRWASSCTVAGVRQVEVPAAATDPQRLSAAALSDTEPSSWSMLTECVSAVAARLGSSAAVVVVTDGVPGDVDRLVELARRSPDLQLTMVTTGVSLHGLPSDQPGTEWWHEELAGLAGLAEQPNVRVAVVRIGDDGRLRLEDARAAEFALRVTAPTGVQVPG